MRKTTFSFSVTSPQDHLSPPSPSSPLINLSSPKHPSFHSISTSLLPGSAFPELLRCGNRPKVACFGLVWTQRRLLWRLACSGGCRCCRRPATSLGRLRRRLRPCGVAAGEGARTGPMRRTSCSSTRSRCLTRTPPIGGCGSRPWCRARRWGR